MVVFSCNVCGEALKKNQVDKHCMTKCRGCESVSCLDCGKDFWGNDYEQHTKCISEEQKYSGKGFVAKVNKGEAKQDKWLEQVQAAIDKNKTNSRLRGPLESLKNYPNVPRKKAKFQNFLKNSLRMRDNHLVSQLWDVLMEEAAKNVPQANTDLDSSEKPEKNVNTNHINGSEKTENGTEEVQEKKLSKRERKEERKKKSNKKEKKDKMNGVDSEENSSHKNKRKNDDDDDDDKPSKGKKRKRQVEVCNEIDEEECEEEETTETPVKKKTKFDWESVITKVLESKGEVSLKKLKKKVLAEYVSQMGEPKSEEKLWSKFNKKVTKNPNFKLSKERVKLKVGAT